MKHNKLLLTLACGIIMPASADVLPVGWTVNPTISLHAPLVVDSTNVSGIEYKANLLLDTPFRHKSNPNAKTLKADTLLTLEKATTAPTVQTVSTRLRPNAYAKGTLTAKCPAVFALYIDGKKQGMTDKTSSTGKLTAQLSMEPYSDHELSIRVLSMPGDTVSPQITLDWAPEADYKQASLQADAGALRRFGLDDTAFGERIVGESVSPDGLWLMTSYSNQYNAEKTLRHSTLTNLKTGQTMTLPSTPKFYWMPQGATLYGAIQGENGYDIISLNPATMEQRTLACDIPEAVVIFNYSGNKFYYTTTNKHKDQPGPLQRQLSPGSRAKGDTDGAQLYECDLTAGGFVRPLTFGGAVRIADIHPTADKLLLMLTRETPTKRPFFTQEALELDTRTGATETIVPEDGFLTSASYSPDGKKILLLGSAAMFNGIGARTGNEPIANDFDTQAFILNRTDGSVTAASADFNPSIKQAVWTSDGTIYVLGENGFENNLYALNPTTLKYTAIPLSVPTLRGFSASLKGDKIAYWGQSENHAGAGYIYDTRRRQDKLVDDPLADRLAEINMGDSKRWTYTDAEGTLIDGYITYPPEFDPSQKYPLIVYYYGGTSPTQKGISNPYSPQLFASRGYVVYTLNPSGTTGYGQEFSARHVNAWGKRTAKDIIDATQALCKSHSFINADKIGCLGASYGGFMTQYLQTQTDMFAAAVSHAGISNVTSYWGEGWWGHSYNGVAAADSYPWSNPDLFTHQGSLFNADKIHTPLLLLHGTADTNVPVGESIQIFNALRILDRPVEFISVDGENHFISDYAKRRLWHSSIMAWFELWLKDNPGWWSALYPDSPYSKK